MKLKSLIKEINDFFFKPQPVHSVAILRILFGVILFINWLGIWKNLDFFWGVEGLLSMETSIELGHPYRFNIFEILPNDPRVATLVALLHIVGILAMTLGLFTRASIAMTFFTLLSFHNRNIFILNSADIVIRNILFLLFFTPCGDVFSLDRVWKRYLGRELSEPRLKSPWALRLIQLQFSIVYISTVLFKMKGTWWADGTAVYIATRLDEFLRAPMEILNNMVLIKFLTWSTLVIEFALGTLVWIKELRYWVLLAGIGLHLGIEATMHIPLFEWVMIVTMLCMVDSRDIEYLLHRVNLLGNKWKSAVVS